MSIYFVILAISFFLFSFFYLFNNPTKDKTNRKLSKVILFFLIFYCGLRPLTVGSDTKMYSNIFESSSNVMTNDSLQISYQTTFLFFNIVKTISLITSNYVVFFLIISSIFNLILYWLIKRYNPNYLNSILFMYAFSFFYYTFSINGIRNGLSYVILLAGIMLFLENKKTVAFFLFLISFSIHASSLIVFFCFILCFYFIKIRISIFIWVTSLTIALFNIDLFKLIINILFETDIELILHKISFYENYNEYKTGFRIDFIIFGLFWGSLFLYKIKTTLFNNTIYKSLVSTFLLLNCLQFLIFQMPFNDRIGILSWFLIPVLTFYPLNKIEFKPLSFQVKFLIILYGLCNLYFIYKYNFNLTNE
jgi:hypothetical protein